MECCLISPGHIGVLGLGTILCRCGFFFVELSAARKIFRVHIRVTQQISEFPLDL